MPTNKELIEELGHIAANPHNYTEHQISQVCAIAADVLEREEKRWLFMKRWGLDNEINGMWNTMTELEKEGL